jgi:hypothetical protein
VGVKVMVVESLNRNEIIQGKKYIYFYRVIKENITLPLEEWQETSELEGACIKEDYVEVQAYGIEVERQDVTSKGIVKIEKEYLKGITPQRHKAHNLMRLLYQNTVSPIHLLDILEDYIDDYVIDFNEELNFTGTNIY